MAQVADFMPRSCDPFGPPHTIDCMRDTDAETPRSLRLVVRKEVD